MSEAAPPSGWRQAVFVAFRHRDYAALWTATALASSSSWMLIVARSWLVYHLSGSSAWVGLATFAQMMPYIVATPVGGALADRLDRRHLSAAAHLLAAASALALAALTLTDLVRPWQVVLLGFVSGVARAVEQPAGQALIPSLVPREDLLNGIALSSLAQQGSRLTGPLLVAPFIALKATSGAFLLGGVLVGLAAAQVLRVRAARGAERQGEGSVVTQFLDGLRYTARTEAVGLLMLLVFFHCMLTMSFDTLLPMLATHHLGHGGTGYSALVIGMGGGAFAGTLALAGLRNAERGLGLLLVTGVVSAATPPLLAAAHAYPLALTAMAGMGASQAAFMALTATRLQSMTPDAFRGRVSSLYFMMAGGVMSLAMLANGRLGDAVGAAPLLAAESLAFLVILTAMLAWRRSLRTVPEPATA